MSSYAISEIQPELIKRTSTGFLELDWLYGYTVSSTGTKRWGIPQGKITLLSGVSGVGKSRLSIALAISLSSQGFKVLYFQNEVDLSTFSGWVKGKINNPENFRASDETSLIEQMKTILEDKPDIIFVDSINQIQEYKSGSKRNIKNIIEGENGENGYRDICKKYGSHVIFLSQINKDKAKTVKGSTTLPHLTDISLNVIWENLPGENFIVKVGMKNRCGRTGEQFKTLWKHTETGIECISNYRNTDEIWRKTHYYPFNNNDHEFLDNHKKKKLYERFFGRKKIRLFK